MNIEENQRQELTAIIPCYNEEKNIEACLQSVKWADEILIVDSFSMDRTLDIARKYTDRILQHEYINSAAQKNWAIPQATYEWILVLDSDERVTSALRTEIQEILARGPDKDGYRINRNNHLMGRRVKYSGWGRDSVLRLFRRSMGRYQDKRVHAEVTLDNTGMLTNRLDHDSISSMASWVQKIDRYSSWKAQDKFERGATAPVLQLLFRPPFRFFKDFILRLGILDGWRGFLIAAMSSFAELVMSAKLIQMSHENRFSP
ncbi:MAG: glycosyltransferase family 2 protein [Thermodesulfobacteriota bacterium]|nr:glycosyltransferase family 2 protein [Thermodesulfobacteriota bacterium]